MCACHLCLIVVWGKVIVFCLSLYYSCQSILLLHPIPQPSMVSTVQRPQPSHHRVISSLPTSRGRHSRAPSSPTPILSTSTRSPLPARIHPRTHAHLLARSFARPHTCLPGPLPACPRGHEARLAVGRRPVCCQLALGVRGLCCRHGIADADSSEWHSMRNKTSS